MDAPAWDELSHGAVRLFLELKKRYHRKRQDAVYLSVRDAMKKLRSSPRSIKRYFAELAHYGFIEKVRAAKLGDGGLAPHYRLTDEIYLGKPPTKDFTFWDGVPYVTLVAPVGAKRVTYGGAKRVTYANRKKPMISKKGGAKRVTYIDVLPSSNEDAGVEPGERQEADGVVVPIGAAAGKLPWSTPILTEITDTELGRQLLENRAGSRRLLARK
jgi:hypothetical protein